MTAFVIIYEVEARARGKPAPCGLAISPIVPQPGTQIDNHLRLRNVRGPNVLQQPRPNSVINYEADLKADNFLVMAHGTTTEMTRAREILADANPASHGRADGR